jgi:hypothetical protein
MITAQILPITDETTLDECAQAARHAGMHLITNGFKVVVSPIVPPGFWKVAVKVKTPAHAALEPQPCAA